MFSNDRLIKLTWMARHGLGCCNIVHQDDPSEESDDNIDGPWSHSGSLNPITLSSTLKTPMQLLTVIPSTSWLVDFSSIVSYTQWCTTLSTATLKSVGKASPPCVVPMVARNWGPWNPFWRVTTSCIDQNFASNPRSLGHTPKPSRVCSRRGLAQDAPYNLILWYVSKTIYLL